MVVHTQDKAPVSHQLTEVKLLQALVVLWWGTTWEGKVMTTQDTFLFALPDAAELREGGWREGLIGADVPSLFFDAGEGGLIIQHPFTTSLRMNRGEGGTRTS